MDLNQRKLTRSEWSSIEVQVNKHELEVLNLIIKGYHDVNIKLNTNSSIFTHLKIEYSEKMEDYLYNKYLRIRADKIEFDLKIIEPNYKIFKIDSKTKINSSDKIRLDRFDDNSLKN